MNNISILIACFAFLVSCKQIEDKKEVVPGITIVHAIENPSGSDSQLPRLFSTGEDLYFSWVEKIDSTHVLKYAGYTPDGDLQEWWNETEIISGKDWFVNWADFPAIAVNKRGDVLTNFLEKSANGTYTYDVKLNLYNVESHLTKKNFILHDDGTQSEHGFVSMRPYAANSFMVTWLDGRDTVGKEHGGGQMTLRGALVFEDGTIDYDTLLDERVCDCCQTATAIGANDRIIVAYRDRSEDEVRDISVVYWTMEDGWSTPKTVGNDQWQIAVCPVNGPSMDAFGDNIALAWFTAADEEGAVNVSFSRDGAESFDQVLRIDSGNATGRVDITMLSPTEAAVLWMEPKGDEEVVQLVKVMADGTKGSPIEISKTSSERASGFPQLERVGDRLFVAWTIVGENTSHIEMAFVSLDQL
ncbi:MAG: hypothetical protein K0U54_10065 [Bacteroidetes bacterium]|nr:hypothetical protein [Bacteroidota bacterium]